MRGSRRDQRDHGAVAVIVALVLAFAMIPALALGTGTYVRSSTATELQRATDSGALAGGAEIPLGNTAFATNYLNNVTGGGLTTTLTALGLNEPGVPDPLADAVAMCTKDAATSANLGHAYATVATCTAKYLPDAGILAGARNCLSGLTTGLASGLGLNLLTLLNNLGSLAGGLLGGLNLTTLTNSLLGDLGQLLPALLQPGIQVTATWHVKAPFDKVFGSAGSTQTSTSIARRRFKNAVVLPNIPLTGSTTVNLNPTLQQTRAEVLSLFGGLKSVLSAIPLLSPCAGLMDNLASDVADAVDPPDNGPNLQAILTDALNNKEPLLVLTSQTIAGLNIPLLDFVPVCVTKITAATATVSVQKLGGLATCALDAPGAFRASLRNS